MTPGQVNVNNSPNNNYTSDGYKQNYDSLSNLNQNKQNIENSNSNSKSSKEKDYNRWEVAGSWAKKDG